MKYIILILFIFPSLILFCNTIYAIANSRTMVILNLGFIGVVIILGGYLLWLELYLTKSKKDKIIKDYSLE